MALSAIQNAIVQAALSAGVDPGIALGVAKVESGFNPGARGAAGEVGLFQLLPSTAASLGVDPTDPAQNIEGGVRYLAQLHSEFVTWEDALAAYNWGPGNVSNTDASGDYPASVQGYVNAVLSQASMFGSSVSNSPVTTSTAAVSAGPLLSSATLDAALPSTPVGYIGWTAGGLLLLWFALWD